MRTLTSGRTTVPLHPVEEAGVVVQVDARAEAVSFEGGQANVGSRGGLALAGELLAQRLLQHRRERATRIVRQLLDLLHQLVVQAHGGPHMSKHIGRASVCQFRPVSGSSGGDMVGPTDGWWTTAVSKAERWHMGRRSRFARFRSTSRLVF